MPARSQGCDFVLRFPLRTLRSGLCALCDKSFGLPKRSATLNSPPEILAL
jgi:hypothetical protein